MATYQRIGPTTTVDELLAASQRQPVLVFKHSLTCPVSHAAFHEFERFLAARPASDGVRYELIEVQNDRPASNEVAQRTGIRHESPQAILLDKGAVRWHASHWKINRDALEEALAS
jgi:bacillithiol system protein YtxJ